MKLPVVLLLSLLLSMMGQWAVAEEYNNIAVSGTVQNPDIKKVRVVLYSYVPGENNMTSTAELDGNNSFHFVSSIREPTFGHLFYGKERIPLYLEPGYEIQLKFEGAKVAESLQIEGVGKENTSFLVSCDRAFSIEQSHLKEKLKHLKEQEFIDWATKRRQGKLELLNAEQEKLGAAFVQFQEADIAYTWANELFAYGKFYQENPDRGTLSEDFYDFMDEVKLHNYEVIHLQSYRDFLEAYVQYNYILMAEKFIAGGGNYYSNMYKVVRRSLRSLPMYHMQAVQLVNALNFLGVDEVTDEYIEFANECPKQAYKNVLHQMVKAQTIDPKEPEVIFTDKYGRSVPLKELTGSIVLLRFTNAEGHVQQDEKLRQQLAEYKDVAFVELSMVNNREAFEKMVYADATEYLKSIMNRPKPGETKREVAPFSYILLNREGLVVSNSLDDPANELAVEKIKALIRQEKRNALAE